MRRFEDVTAAAGAAFASPEVGRGAAFGDVDNDGDVDVVVANNNGPTRLLLNTHATGNNWLGIRAVGGSGRDMLGAMAGLVLSDGSVRWRRVRADGSYGSANDPRIVFGLGPSGRPVRIRMQWPGGGKEEWPLTMSNRWIVVREGVGVQ